MSLSLNEFLEGLGQEASSSFEPKAFYNLDGDFLEYITSPEPYFARRLDGLVTVYMRISDNEIVGARIKEISTVLKKHDGCNILIKDGDKVPVQRIIVVALWENSDKSSGEISFYNRICHLAESRPCDVALPAMQECA